MTLADFRRRFDRPDGVRVNLDWERLAASNPAIHVRTLSLVTNATEVFTPWYARDDGLPCDYDSPGAKPQSLAAAAQNALLLRRHDVSSDVPSDPRLEVPAYRLGAGGLLLLDGNHRAVACVVAGVDQAVTAYVVEGPLDGAVLPDLVHWVAMNLAPLLKT